MTHLIITTLGWQIEQDGKLIIEGNHGYCNHVECTELGSIICPCGEVSWCSKTCKQKDNHPNHHEVGYLFKLCSFSFAYDLYTTYHPDTPLLRYLSRNIKLLPWLRNPSWRIWKCGGCGSTRSHCLFYPVSLQFPFWLGWYGWWLI